jgi:glycosyltransferase involved in cell wall biosynthesis
MRIFHLVPNLNYGGLQKVVQLLSVRQIQAGHSVTIGCWTYHTNHPEAQAELEAVGIRVVYLRRGADGGLSHGRRASLNTLKSYLGAGKADILHIHNPFGYLIYGALAARAAGRTKTVITIHAMVMFDRPKFGRRGRAEFWMAVMLADAVVSVCAEVKDFLRRRFPLPAGKLFVVDNGIDLTPFLAVPDRTPRSEIVFGAAGRMSPEKCHGLLIDAFALARRKYGNVRLRLLGGAGLEAELKQQAHDLGLDDAVEFCGFSDDVAGFLGTLDVFTLPSESEALPLSLVEAIASGLPVIATAVGGVPGIVQATGGGWLCDPNSVEALFAAMELAISATDRLERTARARHIAAERYSADRMASDYEAVYTKLLH